VAPLGRWHCLALGFSLEHSLEDRAWAWVGACAWVVGTSEGE